MLHIVPALCLAVSVLVQGVCALGLLRAPDPFDRLHLQAPAALLGPPLIALAIAGQGGAGAGLKAALCAIFLAAANPLVCFYTAKALLARDPAAAGPEGTGK